MGLIMDDAKKLGEAFKYGVAFSEGYKHRRGVAQDDKWITVKPNGENDLKPIGLTSSLLKTMNRSDGKRCSNTD
jgi:hypothetical protein